MKKQTIIALAALILLAGLLRIFQTHAESLSGEVIDFVFAFSAAIVFGLLGYFRGNKRGAQLRAERQKSIATEKHDGRNVTA